MTLKILAISNEFVYPRSLIPRTLIDILEVAKKYHCESCLLQPGSSDWESDAKSFRVITYSSMPSCFRKVFQILKERSEPVFKAVTYSFNPRIYRILFKLLKSYDLMVCYCIEHSIPALVAGKITGKPTILIFGDINYVRYYRGVRRVHPFLLRLLLVWEKTVSHLVDKIVVLGNDDKDFLVSSGIHDEKIVVIPLSIDFEKVKMMSRRNNDELAFKRLEALKDKGFKILMFHGDLKISPNRFCCEYIINKLAPKLLQEHSKIVFAIVGPNGTSIDSCHGRARVIFTGYVNNLYSCLRLADIGIVPLNAGSGVKNKVLEYFALSKPVITTKIGVENLGIKNMVHCIVTDLGSFPDKVSFLVKNPELMKMLGHNARNYVEENHLLDNYKRCVEIGKNLVKQNYSADR